MGTEVVIRGPISGDHARVIEALAEWMPRPKAEILLPEPYLTHFPDTSLVAQAQTGEIVGFVVAFPSRAKPTMGYIHFVWVSPECRGRGLARELYERVFDLLRARGCAVVEAVTRSANTGSVTFHMRMGFDHASPGHVPQADMAPADFAPEEGMVVLTRRL